MTVPARRGKFNVRRACHGKVAYPTKDAAHGQVRWLRRRGAWAPMLHVYHCRNPECLKWHVGHRIKRKM